MLRTAALTSLVLAASLARAGLSNMRATIPGSIHQCASSNVFFFDTNDSGSKTLLFVSPEDASNLGPGQLTLSTVLSSITPLQKIDGINSADAAEFDFTVDLAENVAFSTLGFLSDGTGKNMNLDRTVMQPLPDAPNCLAGNNNAAAAADVQVASSSSSSAAPVVAASSSSSPPPSSSTTPAPAPTTTSVKAAATPSSSTEYASRFVTSTKPKATSSAASVATSAAAISASLSLPPASSSTNATATATSGNATAPAAAATSPVVVQAKFLLTSFIEISNDKTSDGTVSSSVIKGGQVVGAVNGTILPIGNVLYAPNSTAVLSSNSSTSSAANATAQAQTMLLSTSYTLTTEEGESVFVMAQTPLAQNFTTETLLMDFQSSESNSTLFSNITVLGKAETINATMFRIDAYYLNDASA